MTDFTASTTAADRREFLMAQARNAASLVLRFGARAASLVPSADLQRRATELDFEVASRIDRIHGRLLAPRRVSALAGRLQAELAAIDNLQAEVPQDAAADLAAQKGQIAWLLSELRRAM
ncbi:MAG: hypothetical protein ACRDQ5_11990 [Sciscionella sp.]